MPKSTRSALPTLERKAGGPDNWVERVGGLPQYIDRIARHLHYDRGMSISHAIATAVNTVKRWARKGSVVKYNDPNNKHVTTITAAQAARDVAEWEAKKARAGLGGGRSGRLRSRSLRLSEEAVDFAALAERANQITDAQAKVAARRALFDLAFPPGGPKQKVRTRLAAEGKALPGGGFPITDVASLKNAIRAFGRAKDKPAAKRHIIRSAKRLGHPELIPKGWRGTVADLSTEVVDLALTKDGRKSYKRRGKWGHGFVPLDAEAKEAKAKGSNIAMKRMNRLYGSPSKAENARRAAVKRTLAQREDQKPGTGMDTPKVQTGNIKSRATERVKDVGQSQRANLRDAHVNVRGKQPKPQKEVSKGGGGPSARATRAWNTIGEQHKTIRNGKRYVLGEYKGQQFLTEWVGENPSKKAPDLAKRTIPTIETHRLNQLSTAELRRMLKQGKLSPEVRKKVNKMLTKKMNEKRRRA
jgi:hypothetical protein